jgi:xanthine/CO dehydrogenase XdhC/CoxF family maturation factor
VIEDLISTGGSVIEVRMCCGGRADVLASPASSPTDAQGLDRLAEANVKNVSLSNLDVLAEVAVDTGYITPRSGKGCCASAITLRMKAGWPAAEPIHTGRTTKMRHLLILPIAAWKTWPG